MDRAEFDKLVRERAVTTPPVRETADVSKLHMQMRPHGFVFPSNMPPCGICSYGANEGSHVNPPRTGNVLSYVGGERRIISADKQHMKRLHRTHVYSTGYSHLIQSIPCQACGQSLSASCHTPGLPIGAVSTHGAPAPQTAAADQIVLVRHSFDALSEGGDLCSTCGFAAADEVHADPEGGDGVAVKRFRDVTDSSTSEGTTTDVGAEVQRAFVTQLNGKTILTAPGNVFTDPSGLPRELAAAWEKASAANPHFLWLEGRYVEANMPNRNAAAWNTEDLELGEPSVANGPLNWLHEERHIIGAIAAAKLVLPEREAAAVGERAHIRALAPVWRYLWPTEARQIEAASEDRKLWYSMECISREVACLQSGCEHTQSYVEYMKQPNTRCDHVKGGGARRFADPSFLGGAVIIPPVRPGWGGANATVLRQAAMLAERQEASLTGLSEEEAVSMVAQIISYANGESA